ncbi:hypothetical protein BUALT_Bualt07G0129400 [Buddleja alternifolia]|uniref:Fatty acid desaturase domain-containing protein n=1 Tax=Buddleja alternifolia TaxID=168488 RepID=A0AAV6XHC5_9LAMI|nr:hypothetical protein BUALT_Bualt07G0129400 [Buddleja alternifolia]
MAILIPFSGDEKDSNFGKILMSDVVVKRRRNVFRGRKWTSSDVATFGVVVALHLMCIFAPFMFNWGAFWVAFGLYVITGLFGIGLSFHRNLSHKSFKLPKWLEYFFAYCGLHALQGDPITWVSIHRYHHQFVDSEKDPHSPIEGFWFSHMSWLFDHNTIAPKCGKSKNVGDLEKQLYYRCLRSTYIIHPIVLGAMLYALGGFPYIVWGMDPSNLLVHRIEWTGRSATLLAGDRTGGRRGSSPLCCLHPNVEIQSTIYENSDIVP